VHLLAHYTNKDCIFRKIFPKSENIFVCGLFIGVNWLRMLRIICLADQREERYIKMFFTREYKDFFYRQLMTESKVTLKQSAEERLLIW
jgi:hypothetical protein